MTVFADGLGAVGCNSLDSENHTFLHPGILPARACLPQWLFVGIVADIAQSNAIRQR